MPVPFELPGEFRSPVIASAIHSGHDLRREIGERLVLDEQVRLREEDPYTDAISAAVGSPVVAHRSRFEVDLNRPRDAAVYRSADDCWGLDVWQSGLPDDVVARSLEIYDEFYRDLAERLDRLATRGPFVLFDVHSYNHRRDGPDEPPAAESANPDVNVGTGSMDRGRWAAVVDALTAALSDAVVAGRPLDVRENVRFRGANLARWVHERYPEQGCAVALEFKKTFMNEWTGEVREDRLRSLRDALGLTAPAVRDALGRVPV